MLLLDPFVNNNALNVSECKQPLTS